MNKTLADAWDKAERTGYPIDIGDCVACDFCNADYTQSEEQGGVLFTSYAVCPVCAPSCELQIQALGEGAYVRARAEPGETFKAFVIRIRAGNSTVSIKLVRL